MSKLREAQMEIPGIIAIQHNDFTYVEVEMQIDGRRITSSGMAKRDPKDKINDSIGINLATARAFDNLAKRLYRISEGLVKHDEQVEIYKAYQKTRKVPKKYQKKADKKGKG